jgi:glycosyltransferase involved in cell wall biosynthesis
MERSVKVCALVLDFLPVFRDQQVPAVMADHWHRYTRLLFEFDGVLCISRKVAQDFQTLVDINHIQLKPDFQIGWSHLGADFVHPGEEAVASASEREALVALQGQPYFLVVSSIAPHKGQPQALAAFEQLWAQGSDACLVLLGGYLWMMEDFVAKLEGHPELGRRLLWFRGGSDGLLQALFAGATCLLSPSEDEGFGLPVVEAARLGVPLLLRDIPVFREVAGNRARYFQGLEPEPLASAIAQALADAEAGRLERFRGPRTLTWAQAARNFWQLLTRLA